MKVEQEEHIMKNANSFSDRLVSPAQVSVEDAIKKINEQGYKLLDIKTDFGGSLKYPNGKQEAKSLHIAKLYSNGDSKILIYQAIQLEVINVPNPVTLPFYLTGLTIAIESEKGYTSDMSEFVPLAVPEQRKEIRVKLPAPPKTAIEMFESVLRSLSTEDSSQLSNYSEVMEHIGIRVDDGGTVCFTKQDEFDEYWNIIMDNKKEYVDWFEEVVEQPHTIEVLRKMLSVLLWDQ